MVGMLASLAPARYSLFFFVLLFLAPLLIVGVV